MADVNAIDRRTEMADSVILGLRLAEGVSEHGFSERFGLGLRDVYSAAIAQSIALGLLWEEGEGDGAVLRLTRSGRLLANEAFVRFLGA